MRKWTYNLLYARRAPEIKGNGVSNFFTVKCMALVIFICLLFSPPLALAQDVRLTCRPREADQTILRIILDPPNNTVTMLQNPNTRYTFVHRKTRDYHSDFEPNCRYNLTDFVIFGNSKIEFGRVTDGQTSGRKRCMLEDNIINFIDKESGESQLLEHWYDCMPSAPLIR